MIHLQGEKQKFFSTYISNHWDLYEIINPRLYVFVSLGEVVEQRVTFHKPEEIRRTDNKAYRYGVSQGWLENT
jgi:hypothetical protein